MNEARRNKAFGALLILLLLGSIVLVIVWKGRPRLAGAAHCPPDVCAEIDCGSASPHGSKTHECCASCLSESAPAPSAAAPQDCASVRCSQCPPGTRTVKLAGSCCPKCQPVDEPDCQRGRQEYEQRSAKLIERLQACEVDSDCISASFADACGARCPMPLNKKELGPVVEQLKIEAEAHCGSCRAPEYDCPKTELGDVSCSDGRCAFRPPPPVNDR